MVVGTSCTYPYKLGTSLKQQQQQQKTKQKQTTTKLQPNKQESKRKFQHGPSSPQLKEHYSPHFSEAWIINYDASSD